MLALLVFCSGILKRAYFWAPSILLDPFDLYNKYVRLLMPSSLRGELNMPSEWFPWVLMAGLLWAAFMTYRELHQRTKLLGRQLDNRARRNDLRDMLADFLEEGRELMRRCADETQLPPNTAADDWNNRVKSILLERLGKSYVIRFESHAELPMTANSIDSVPHRNLWGGIWTRVARLEQFLGELS